MIPDHEMRHESTTNGEHVFVCDECGRRLVLTANGPVVLDRGDEAAVHHGSTLPGVRLTVGIG